MKKGPSSSIEHPKIITWTIYLALFVFLSGFVLAVSVAYVYGGTSTGPGYFSIMNNYISDLGSHHYTPATYIFDLTMIITAALLCPMMITMHKQMLQNWEELKPELGTARNRAMRIVLYSGFFGVIVGISGFLGVGVFSEDRSKIGTFHEMHLVVSIMVWGGLAFASLCYGLAAMRMKTLISRILGFFMIVGPITSVILFTLAAFVVPEFIPSRPLEWVMLACAFWWMVPVGLILLRDRKSVV
jgi:hypothetical membrane protein